MLFMQMSKTIADNALKRDGTILHSYHFIPMGSKECRGTLLGVRYLVPIYMGDKECRATFCLPYTLWPLYTWGTKSVRVHSLFP